MKLRSITSLVATILKTNPATRDDDRLLIYFIWMIENFDVKGYALERFSNHDTITRARRKLQSKFPHLQGRKWQQRQKMIGKNRLKNK